MALPTTPYARQWAYKALSRALGIYPKGSPDMAQMVADIQNARAELGEPKPRYLAADWFGALLLNNSQFGKFASGGVVSTRFRRPERMGF